MGGLALAQDEASARFDGMPENAIATGMVDFVCKPEETPPLLLRLLFGRKHKIEDAHAPETLGDQSSFLKIFMLLRARKALDFSAYKLATILRRVRRRMEVNMLDSSEKYATFLQGSPQEVDKLFHELLIGVTSFYRDETTWQLVAERVVPQLFAGKPPGSQIRVWVPGCCTGEEAYTLAMIFSEVLGPSLKDYDVKIFATDVDKKSLEFAGIGRYPEGIETQLTPEQLQRFFVKQNDSYKISDPIRNLVIFAAQNITADPPFSRIDLITCRNLLIYLHPSAQRRVLSTFHFALNPNAFLVLGSSESLGEAGNLFTVVDSKNKVFQALGKKKGLKLSSLTSHGAPAAPAGPRSRFGAGTGGGLGPLMTLPVREDIMRPMTDSLLSVCLPPTVAVNANGEIVHIHGDVSPFVRHSPGRASLNILKGTHKDLCVTIGIALSRVQSEKSRISYREVAVHIDDSRILVDVSVIPFPPERQHVGFCAIAFETRGVASRFTDVAADATTNSESRQRIADLEWELQNSRENLHAVIEELETSNEELQSTNEELLAANEELQSTNEELQSLNEELHTVNAEYQLRIEELTEAKSDIDNLLKSSDIGVILLDKQLRIRKFNPAVTREFHLIESDLGRPITHVSNRFKTGELPGLAEEVLRGGSHRTFEAISDTGSQYSV
ncbi:MAG: PAS domain-containing protein [Silvanigrellales bacterium]|nr:PAS domain-containing protein [Silvanigrellales bacterium]